MRHFNFLVVFTAICLLSSCDYLEPDDTPTTQGIMLTNKDGLEGTYIISGAHSYLEKTTKWLSSIPKGEYSVFFTNMDVYENACYITGKNPVFVGETTFVVNSTPQKEIIPVPTREITCHLSFKPEEGVSISQILVNGTPTVLFIDGEFGNFTSMQLSGDSYVVATEMEVSICIINQLEGSQEMKILKMNIDAKPGRRYSLKVRKDNISISSD